MSDLRKIYCITFSDRFIVLGNHRDAWTFGGSDPSSGTTVLMEVARVIGKLVKETGNKNIVSVYYTYSNLQNKLYLLHSRF